MRFLLFAAVLIVPRIGLALSGEGVDPDVEAARKLFTEAYADEKAGHCPEALEKYKRVQAVKDTPNIRFRIGSCSEATNQLRAAMQAYDGTVRLGRGDPQFKDVVQEAQKKLDALTPKMGRLNIQNPEHASVRVDEQPVADGEPVWVEPGMHGVSATAPGKKPFHTDVSVKEQATSDVAIAMEPEVVVQPPPPLPPPPPPSPVPKIVGWSLVGLGAALGIGAGVSIIVRETAIASINDACKTGCPVARMAELQGTRDRALVAGPLAAVLAGAGGACVATGVILLLAAPKKSAAFAPVLAPGYGGLAWHGTF